MHEQEFWHREIEEPCILLLAKTQSLGALIGEDAMVDQPSGCRNTSSVKRLPSVNPKDDTPPPSASSSSKRQRGPDIREHKLGEDGLFSHKREWSCAACSKQENAQRLIVVVDAQNIHNVDTNAANA